MKSIVSVLVQRHSKLTLLLNFVYGIPTFVLRVHADMTFEAYHLGVRIFVPTLTKNRITKLQSWSALEETIRYLASCTASNKLDVIQQHIESMSSTVRTRIYSPNMIMSAFQYFATSRSLYKRLINDYQLPSVSTLTRITTKVSKVEDVPFLKRVLDTTEKKQKHCVLLHDEVYVKKMLLYHGGTVFGKAQNHPSKLAETVLGIMIICLHGGPSFTSKIVPVSNLDTNYLHDQVVSSQANIEQAGGIVKAIVCDGNRTNQAYFRKYVTLPDQPWLTEDGTYLLYDFVHLLKNIRNLWLTEKTGELTYVFEGVVLTAKWQVIRDIHELESYSLVKMSCLTDAAVNPKPIERQRVETCLKVFCNKTAQALLHHPKMKQTQKVADTYLFIEIVLKWWKILNVKQKGLEIRNREPLQAVISSVDDERLTCIENFGSMCLQLAGRQGRRVKQLSTDTAKAMHSTCKGVVDLTKDLLSNCHYEYVCLGRFTTDPLEKEFGRLRQGSGATYFINVQQITEKIRICKASLLLSLSVDVEDIDNIIPGHSCSSCSYTMDKKASSVFDNLPQLEESIPDDGKSSLVYIAGYVVRKRQSTDLEDTSLYYQQYGAYTEALNRGSITIPMDSVCQCVFFFYVMFNLVKEYVCKVSLVNLFMKISDFYCFNASTKECSILSNIFL